MRIIHDTYRFAADVKKTSGMFFHDNPKGGTHGWVESNSFQKNFSLFFLTPHSFAKLSIRAYLLLKSDSIDLCQNTYCVIDRNRKQQIIKPETKGMVVANSGFLLTQVMVLYKIAA